MPMINPSSTPEVEYLRSLGYRQAIFDVLLLVSRAASDQPAGSKEREVILDLYLEIRNRFLDRVAA